MSKELTVKPTGRPSKYSQALADEICEYLASGESMRTVCARKGMPSMQTVFTWLRSKEGFLEQYTRAKQEAADALVEQMLDIADSNTTDVNRDRLRVDTRKWIASKLKPKKYGDKMEVDNTHRVVMPILGGEAKRVESTPEKRSLLGDDN